MPPAGGERLLPASAPSIAEEDGPLPPPSAPRPVPFCALFRFAKAFDVLLIITGATGALLQGAMGPAMALFMQGLFSSIFIPNDDGTIPPERGPHTLRDDRVRSSCELFAILGAAAAVTACAQCFGLERAAMRQARAARLACFEHLLGKDIAWYDDHNTGEVATRLTRSCSTFREALSEPFGNVIRSIASLFLGFGIAFWMDWRMALAMCCTVPFIVCSVGCFIATGARFSAMVDQEIASAGAVAEGALSTIRIVAAYGGFEREFKHFDAHLAAAQRLGNRMGLAQGISLGFVQMMLYFSMGTGFYVGSWLVADGYEDGCWRSDPPFGHCFTGATMMGILQAVITGGLALASIGPSLATIGAARAGAAWIFAVLDEPVRIDARAGGAKLSVCDGDLEFCQVRFAYPMRPSAKVLDGLSLRVPAGTSMAFVGLSGSGKSTLIQLVERFYDPSAGRVTLDGHDIRSLDLEWLRSRIALVQQEPVLFSGSIFDNIARGRQGASPEQVEAAARAANAHGFIAALPNGYRTKLGDRGAQLSGGQKQRIAIARGVIRDPVLLMLDEATSALDAESERVVQEAIDQLLGARRMTTLVIAHRLTTIQKSNRICVLARGAVADLGTHAELLSRPGLYADLVSLQSVAGPQAATRDLMHTIIGEGQNTSHRQEMQSPHSRARSARSVPPSAHRRSSAERDAAHRRAHSARARSRRPDGSGLEAWDLNGSSGEEAHWSQGLAMRRSGASVGIGLPFLIRHPEVSRGRDSGYEEDEFAFSYYDDDEGDLSPSSRRRRAARSRARRPVAQEAPSVGTESTAATSAPAASGSSCLPAADCSTDAAPPEDVAATGVSVGFLWSLNRRDAGSICVAMIATLWTAAAFPLLGVVWASSANLLNAPPAAFSPAAGAWEPIFDAAHIRSSATMNFAEFCAMGAILLPSITLQYWGFRKAAESLTRQLTTMMLKAMMRQEIGWFDMRSTGMLVERLASDVPLMRCFTFEAVYIVVQTILSVFGGLAFAMIASWRLALCSIVCIPCMMLAHCLTGSSIVRRHENDASMVVSEAVDNIRTVAAFGLQDSVLQSYTAAVVEEMKADQRISTANSITIAYGSAFTFFLYAGLAYISSLFMNDGLLGPSALIAVISPIMFSAGGLAQAQSWSSQKAKARGASARIAGLLRRQPKIDAYDDGNLKLDRVEGRIEFRSVSFRYPARPDVPVFQGLDLTISPGTTCAFVGPSGCGKSTTVALLQRFYDPLEGAVLLDGHDLRELSLPWLRMQMALVQQEPVLFAGTIRQNIAYGKEGASEAEVIEAARTANAHDFVSSFPERYNTDVGARGAQLSGGQKQRIAIARAMVREPTLLLLDEATSALDLESERSVQEALDSLLKLRPCMTTIVIAHRLSTIQTADEIFVLSSGRVTEHGTHDELLKARGVYHSLIASQKQRADAGSRGDR